MAKNKRVALTLPPEIYDVLSEISLLMGQPKTSLITEILVDSLPVFQTLVIALKQAKDGQQKLALETTAKFLQDGSNLINQAHIDFGVIKARNDK